MQTAPVQRDPIPQPCNTEALIIGGGPAGLAAAIALRQRGIECVVVEARLATNAGSLAGIDKACGEGLMPDSREILSQLGITLTEADGHLFRGIRFANAQHSVEGCFPNGCGIGVRRPHLHALLTRRAEDAGATLLFNSHVQLPAVTRTDHGCHTTLVNGRPIRFRWLIGADGQASTVRHWAGLEATTKHSLRYGFRTHYRVAPWSDYVEVHWGPHGQLYVTPVAADCVCVVYITRDPHCDRANILTDFPAIASRLDGVETVSPQRGAVSATSKLRSVTTDSVALIGDASGSADAITGEGLALSFRQALALADSIAGGSLTPYRVQHPAIVRLPHAMASLMLLMDRWPALQRRGLHTLAYKPAVFSELLQAHMGHRQLPALVVRRAPAFGFRFLAHGAGA